MAWRVGEALLARLQPFYSGCPVASGFESARVYVTLEDPAMGRFGAMASLGGSESSFRQGYGYFNQVLGSTLPPSLERLWLSNAYDQPLHGVASPNGIVTLGLPFRLRLNCFQGITWPSTVETIFMDTVDTGIRLPKGAKVKIFDLDRERWIWEELLH